jgi:heterodisulfide reductase subunit A
MVSRLYQKDDKVVVMGSDIAVGIQVEIEDQELEALIDEVAPVTVNGEELPR